MLDKSLLMVDMDGVISTGGIGSDDRPASAFHNGDAVIHFHSSDAGNHLLAPAGAGAGR